MDSKIVIVSSENWTLYQDCLIDDTFYLILKNSPFQVRSSDNQTSVTIELKEAMLTKLTNSYYKNKSTRRSPGSAEGILDDVISDPKVTDEDSLESAIVEQSGFLDSVKYDAKKVYHLDLDLEKNADSQKLLKESLSDIVQKINQKYYGHMQVSCVIGASFNQLHAALNILEKWGCTVNKATKVLGFDNNQFERINLVMDIHESLTKLFNNQDNIDGFMTMKNNNPYFEGRTPLSIIESGELCDLKEVSQRINLLLQL